MGKNVKKQKCRQHFSSILKTKLGEGLGGKCSTQILHLSAKYAILDFHEKRKLFIVQVIVFIPL